MNRSVLTRKVLLLIVLCVQALLIMSCSVLRPDITISYVGLFLDDWKSIPMSREGSEGPALRLEFKSDVDLVSLHADKEKNIWFKLTDCHEKKLRIRPYVFIGIYPIGIGEQYGKKFLLPTHENKGDDIYHVYFDFYNQYKEIASSTYNLSRNYDLRIDDFDICLQVRAASMVPFSLVKSNIITIKNSTIKSAISAQK